MISRAHAHRCAAYPDEYIDDKDGAHRNWPGSHRQRTARVCMTETAGLPGHGTIILKKIRRRRRRRHHPTTQSSLHFHLSFDMDTDHAVTSEHARAHAAIQRQTLRVTNIEARLQGALHQEQELKRLVLWLCAEFSEAKQKLHAMQADAGGACAMSSRAVAGTTDGSRADRDPAGQPEGYASTVRATVSPVAKVHSRRLTEINVGRCAGGFLRQRQSGLLRVLA